MTPPAAGPRHGGTEGWQWERIQFDPCPQCGQHPAARAPGSLGDPALASAAAWADFLTGASDGHLRSSPAPAVWTPIQYGAHVRDMLRVFADRILVAVAEDNPAVAWFDPGPEGWASYNRLEPAALAAELHSEAERLARVLGEREPADWSRTALRDGRDLFTVAGLACFAVHEAHHHLLDATGGLPPSG